MQYCLDAKTGVDDLFGTGRITLLVEMLAEARTSAERFAFMEDSLAAILREHRHKPVAYRAAAFLKQNPHWRVRHLAARLEVSECHPSRSFQAMFGMSPKQFARIARIESCVVSAGSRSRLGGYRLCDRIHRSGPHDQRLQRDRKRAAGATGPPVQQLRTSLREHVSFQFIW
jgi:hypothetical protein